jgi:hypothetical protein
MAGREAEAAAFFEADGARPFDPVAMVAGCLERRVAGLLLGSDALPDSFFDLSTGVAGELVQKLVNYHIRMAAVVPDLAVRPPRFREFAREANAGRQFRFFGTREEAVAWLESVAPTSPRDA